jgi:hypothetical protein
VTARTRPRRSNRRSSTAVLVSALLVGAAFVLGLGLGAALDDNPEPGTTTFERTVRVAPAQPTATVTVTISGP